MIRTRFAPSPTGFLHVGGLRTALYSYLIARQNKGKFVLRIEDTDQKRYVEGGVENIIKTLKWAGIEPDEGPFFQSKRLDIYKKYADELVAQGQAYHCFCTSERLEELRENQQKNKLPTGYDGHCRSLDPIEAKKRVQAGEKYVIRLKMPQEGETVFNDLIKGEVKFKNKSIDDQVIIKSDGFPTYHLAVVVDDHEMEITHVIRGDEWLPSTPKHLQLYKYFGWGVPQFAHLPLLLNTDKSKLSKRQGDVAVEDYAQKGYLPEAIVNFIAFLGWNPGTEQELFTLPELIKEFKIEKINKSGAIFNLEKLDWYNQQYIKKLSNEELTERSLEWLKKSDLEKAPKQLLTKAVGLEKERIVCLSELTPAIKFIIKLPDYPAEMLVWKKSDAEEVKKILPELITFLNTKSIQSWNRVDLQEKIGEWIKEKGYQNGSVLWPLRVALSGQEKSPGPFEIAEVLGKDESLKRIEIAVSKF